MADLPRIQRINEIGSTPFRVVAVMEKILQGWSKAKKKTLYLFKAESGNWAYYDKDRRQTIEVTNWQDKEALIMGSYVPMSLYFRLQVIFDVPVSYSAYKAGVNQKQVTYEAIIVIPKSAMELLEAQMVGRDPASFYRFNYKQLKKGASIEGVTWVK